jgi:hypothetical protein
MIWSGGSSDGRWLPRIEFGADVESTVSLLRTDLSVRRSKHSCFLYPVGRFSRSRRSSVGSRRLSREALAEVSPLVKNSTIVTRRFPWRYQIAPAWAAERLLGDCPARRRISVSCVLDFSVSAFYWDWISLAAGNCLPVGISQRVISLESWRGSCFKRWGPHICTGPT